MMKISGAMEGCIKQNNGIDIYVEYFEEPDDGTQCEAPQVKTIGLHTKLWSMKFNNLKLQISVY